MFGTYKPNPNVYLGAVKMLNARPADVMLVAAHAYEVDGARAVGLRTAYVFRSEEFGPGKGEDPGNTSRFDLVTSSFVELADRLKLYVLTGAPVTNRSIGTRAKPCLRQATLLSPSPVQLPSIWHPSPDTWL